MLAERDEVLRRETNEQSLRIRGEFASRGLGASGMVVGALIELQIDRLRKLVQAAVDIRREMSATVPELASPEQLAILRDRLHGVIDAQWTHLAGTLRQYGYTDDVPRILGSAQYDSTTLSLKSEADRGLRNVEDAYALGMLRPSGNGSIVINITGTVGGLNLGAIAGDMNAVVNAFGGQEGQALAQAIKRVTEAVAADNSSSPEERAEAIETLAAITDEAARPPERRRLHLVRALIARAGPLILKIPDMVDAWNRIESWFVPKPPGT